ncbi:MAG TPA: hypothetical protein VFC04_06565 [Actinomycetota bacterium]|nr:hypothetical protein [Actinomycetota bacterium]
MRRIAAIAAVLAAVLTACGRGSSAGGPETVRIGASDAGSTVSVGVGDRVVVALGQPPPTGRWALAAYPRGVLSLDSSDPGGGRFDFTAEAAGSGQVLVIMKTVCGSVAAPCTGAGAEDPENPGDGVGGDFPLRPFRVTVEVS